MKRFCFSCDSIVHATSLAQNRGKVFRMKIPTVCELDGVDVRCIDFITLIKESGEVFDGAPP